MYLIVGLGNPGSKYSGSRHNSGFQVVEALSRRLKTGRPIQRHRSLYAVAEYGGKRLMLVQPLTFMNRSGPAVKELISNYREQLEDIMIIYDDLDLPPGSIRLRKKGGSGGHRGIQSIIEALDTVDFPRLRIGVGKPPPGVNGSEYVLRPPEPLELDLVNAAISRAVEAVLVFVVEGLDAAMNKFNQNDY